MREFQEALANELPARGWRIFRESTHDLSGEGRYATAWWLASTVVPVGRTVLVEFRVQELEVLQWYNGPFRHFVARFTVAIRFPQQGPSPEFVAEDRDLRTSTREFFRVLEWFRDPTGHNLYLNALETDWLPPEDWDAERWRADRSVEFNWDREATWQEMLHLVGPQLTERKLRLLSCALARQLPVSMLEEKNRLAICAAERYAEGEIPKRQLKKVARASDLAWLAQARTDDLLGVAFAQLQQEVAGQADRLAAETLRDIVAHPFREWTTRSAWFRADHGVVRQLLNTIVADQDFALLGVLADALEDAGCREQAILEHCRQTKAHFRGCWVVDLLQGKT